MFDENNFEPFLGHDDDDLHILADLQTTIENCSQDLLTSPEYLRKNKRKKSTTKDKGSRNAIESMNNHLSMSPTANIAHPARSPTAKVTSLNNMIIPLIQEPASHDKDYNFSNSDYNMVWKDVDSIWSNGHNSQHHPSQHPSDMESYHHHYIATGNASASSTMSVAHIHPHISNYEHGGDVHGNVMSSDDLGMMNMYNIIYPYPQHAQPSPMMHPQRYDQQQSVMNHQHYSPPTSYVMPNNIMSNYHHVPLLNLQPHQPLQSAILPSISAMNIPPQTSIPDASFLLSALKSDPISSHLNMSQSKSSGSLSTTNTTTATARSTKTKKQRTSSSSSASTSTKNSQSLSSSTCTTSTIDTLCKITGELVAENGLLSDWQHESIDDPIIQASWRDLNKHVHNKAENFISNIFDSHILSRDQSTEDPVSNHEAMKNNNNTEEIREMLGLDGCKDLDDVDLAAIEQHHDYDVLFSHDAANSNIINHHNNSKRTKRSQSKDLSNNNNNSSIHRKEKSISSTCLKFVMMFGMDHVATTFRHSNPTSTSTQFTNSNSNINNIPLVAYDRMISQDSNTLALDCDHIDINTLAVDPSNEDTRIDQAAGRLGVHVRRLYEVLSILELLSLVTTKRAKFQWNGTKELHRRLAKIQGEGLKKYQAMGEVASYHVHARSNSTISTSSDPYPSNNNHMIANEVNSSNDYQHSTNMNMSFTDADDIRDDADALVSFLRNDQKQQQEHKESDHFFLSSSTMASYDDEDGIKSSHHNFDASEGLMMLTDYATRYIDDPSQGLHINTTSISSSSSSSALSCEGVSNISMAPVPRQQRSYSEAIIQQPRPRQSRISFDSDPGQSLNIWPDEDMMMQDSVRIRHSSSASYPETEEYSNIDPHKMLPSMPSSSTSASTSAVLATGKGSRSKSLDDSHSMVALCKHFLELFLVGHNHISIQFAIHMISTSQKSAVTTMSQGSEDQHPSAKKQTSRKRSTSITNHVTITDGLIRDEVDNSFIHLPEAINADNLHHDKNFSDKSRRLYDIANVLTSIGILRKISPKDKFKEDSATHSKLFAWDYLFSPAQILQSETSS